MPSNARPERAVPRPPPRPWRAPWARLRRRPVLWWAATVALALATAGVVGGSLARVETAAARFGDERSVLVATSPVEPGELVDRGNAELRSLPAAVIAPGAVGAEQLGARATHPIHVGEVVHERRLAPAGHSPVTALLPAGTRGVAVPTDVAGLTLQVGDVVDVLATVDTLDAGSSPTVQVAPAAAVVDVAEAAVTVAVPVEQAPKVAYAVAAGIVSLTLVGP